MVVSLKTDLRFPIPGQQGHGDRIIHLIVQKAIIDKQYDIMQLNVTLFKYTNEILGV